MGDKKKSLYYDSKKLALIALGIGAVAGALMVFGWKESAPPEIVEARETVKRLKFAPWDVAICTEYQQAGHKVCTYDRETGYDDQGPYDSMGNLMTRGCDGWLDRAANYCPKCTSPGRCDEPFE
jgi:hypothetical protein